MTQEHWNAVFVIWAAIGFVVCTAYVGWYIEQPKMTRFEFSDGSIIFMSGRVSSEKVTEMGFWRHLSITSRTVLVKPRLP